MFRRLLILSLLSVFALTAVGVEVEKLYCDGKLSKTGIEVKSCCELASCCSVESDFYSLTGSYEASDFAFTFRSLQTLFVHRFAAPFVLHFPSVVLSKSVGNPPDSGRLYVSIPTRILYCSFQI